MLPAAGTITWLAPQFTAGLLDNYRPWRLFEEAFLYGLVDPLTSVAVGGLVGMTLWFRPRRAEFNTRWVRGILAMCNLRLSRLISAFSSSTQRKPLGRWRSRSLCCWSR